jgi:hypothetical protein
MVEEVAGQVFESVMTALSWGAGVTWGWGRHEGDERRTERVESGGRGPAFDVAHSTQGLGKRDPTEVMLRDLVADGVRPVHRLPPVFDHPTGVGHVQVFDDPDQSFLPFGEVSGNAVA